MISLESVILADTIDAHEKRNVGIINVPGEFMTANINEDVKMEQRGHFLELFVKIEPIIYQEHMKANIGKIVLFVQFQNNVDVNVIVIFI